MSSQQGRSRATALRSVLQTGAGLLVGMLLALMIVLDVAAAAKQTVGEVQAEFAVRQVIRVERAATPVAPVPPLAAQAA